MTTNRTAPVRLGQPERRARIEAAVINSISESRLPDVQISDIVRRSGVALKTIYRQYGSKDYLLAVALRSWHHDISLRATANTGPSTCEALVWNYLVASLGEYAENPGMTKLLVRHFSAADSPVVAVLREIQQDSDANLAQYLQSVDGPNLDAVRTITHALKTAGATSLAVGALDLPDLLNTTHNAVTLALGER